MPDLSRSILIILLIASLVSVSGAYIITIHAPEQVIIGNPLVVNGSTSFPEDTYFDLVLYYSKYTAGELKREKIIIDQSKEFRTDFETRNLEKGQYKVEVHSIVSDGKEFVDSSLGSASVTRRVIQLVDRSDELVFESQAMQNLSTALVIAGRVKGSPNGVVTLRAFGPDEYTYGPQQIITNPGFADKDGHFSTHIPVTVPGEYHISISDKNGFITESSFNVTDEITGQEKPVAITPVPLATQPQSPPGTPEPTRTSSPAPTQSPLPGIIAAFGLVPGYYLYKKE
jgi:hypothetical protein